MITMETCTFHTPTHTANYGFSVQELDLSGCRSLTDKAFERLSNRLHLWAPRLHTVNVARCEGVSVIALEAALNRRPARGCVIITKDGGLIRTAEASIRRVQRGSPAAAPAGKLNFKHCRCSAALLFCEQDWAKKECPSRKMGKRRRLFTRLSPCFPPAHRSAKDCLGTTQGLFVS